MNGPILDLVDDAPARLWIRGTGGEQLWVATLDDLGLNARLELHSHWERVNALAQQAAGGKPLTKAEEREYSDRYMSMVRTLVPGLRAGQVKALGQEAREAICTAFFTHRMAFKAIQRVQAMLAEQTEQPDGGLTGDGSSPSSSTTTEVLPSAADAGETSP